MKPTDRERRLRTFETDYGRHSGWNVEHQGRRVGLLTDVRREEMFWDSYRLEALTGEPDEVAVLLSASDRWLQCGCVFRNCEFGTIAPHAFPAGGVFLENGRVLMRGLYLAIDGPSIWERWLLWRRAIR